MKKKLMVVLLAGVMILGLAACGGTSPSAPKDADQDSSVPEEKDVKEDAENSNESAASIEKTTLVDQNGIVITAQKLVEDEIWGSGIQFLIENNSSKNQTIQCDYVVVNNFMMTSMLFSSEVAAGKKANETLYFPEAEMSGAGITTITDMSFVFHSLNPETYQREFTTEEVTISTSAAGSYEQKRPSEGQELYNQNGIKIIGEYVDEDSLWGAGVQLFIENTSNQDMTIDCDQMSINGFMVTPYFSCQVNRGRMAISNITIMSSDLETNGIETIQEIELVFQGLNPKSYQKIFQSDPITFSPKL